MRDWKQLAWTGVLAATLGAAGCGGAGGDEHAHDHDDHGHAHDDATTTDGGHGHSHEAPHDGALIAVGDHFAHLELVLDAAAGQLTLYVLDGDASGGRRVAHESLDVHVTQIDGEAADVRLSLAAVASRLTGETVGDTSQFQASDESLVGAERFTAELATISIRGQTLEGVELRYPEGGGE